MSIAVCNNILTYKLSKFNSETFYRNIRTKYRGKFTISFIYSVHHSTKILTSSYTFFLLVLYNN